MSEILVVDDDGAGARTLELHLKGQGHRVAVAHSVDQGLEAARAEPPELVILDIRMPGRSGLQGLPDFKAAVPGVHIIMITAFHDMESTIEAMQQGAEDYIHKPIDIDELDSAIDKILRSASSVDDQLAVGSGAEQAGAMTMVGRSRVMKEVFKTIGLVAKSPATVLVTGESGTGKELVARAIHRAGAHPNGPFVVINCAALVETLLESDMFGHERGAFTGAVSRQAGKFALARGGSIFLDEISELSPAMQAKLLRVLQYKEFTPLGAKEVEHTDARIVAATNRDLAEAVAEGSFREDLFYRLQVVNIHLPPLRERMEDLPDLVQTLLGRINREMGRRVTYITQEVMDGLRGYDWPGNVRELENLLMKAVALCPGHRLTLDPPVGFQAVTPPPSPVWPFEHALRRDDGSLEIRYAIRPIERMEIAYDDPHSSAPDPDHVFPMVFQTLIGLFSDGGHSPSREYLPEQAKAKFNADWAAAALFDANPAFAQERRLALLVALHKGRQADAYVLYLFDDYEQVKPHIDAALGALRFLPDPAAAP